MYYSNKAYVFLGVIYIVYLFQKYYKNQIIFILIGLLCCGGLMIRPFYFQEHIRGEVKAVLYNGIQVNHYLIKTKSENYQIGDIIEADISIGDFPKRSNDGRFDECLYLKGKGIRYVVYPSQIEKVGQRFHLRNSVLSYVENHCDQRLQGLYLYLLLGSKTDQIDDLSQMASSLAILHVFAISGMHFSLMTKYVVEILSHFISEKKANRVALFIMGLYALCLEGNVAAWRAFLSLLMKQMGIKDAQASYGLVGLFFLLINPTIIFQTSFIYSMSLYFIVLLTKDMKFSTFYVYIASMMISSYFNYEVLPLGFIFGLLFNFIISSLFPIFVLDALLGNILSHICFYLYQGMLVVMEYSCQFSFQMIIGKPPEWMIVCFYLSYVFSLYQFDLYKKKKYLLLPLLFFCLMLSSPYLNPYGKVVMIDVGQGDCFLVSFPYNKENILIDTGGLLNKDVASEIVIPVLKYLGVKKIDTLYISHEDFDHCGGLNSLTSNFDIEEVVTKFDEKMHQSIKFKQLNPQTYHNENDNSLVIYTSLGGLNYLFTGDISEEVEKDLIILYPWLDIDVLKVSHHGSGSSSCNAFLSKITPTISLISVGKNNKYGHPSKSVISRLKAYGSLIYRSDIDGSVFIYFTENESFIEMEN